MVPGRRSRKELEESVSVKIELERRRIIKRCAEDPWHWLTQWTKTFDEHAEEKGVEVYKSFPDKEYLRLLVGQLNQRQQRTFIPKSRQMLISWAVTGYITWSCQFSERKRWVIQSKDEQTAGELVAYCKCLYEQQPEWMRRKFPLDGGKIETEGGKQSKLLNLWKHGSRVIGVPSGAAQVRQAHPTGVFFDEAAFLPEFEAAYNSANPVASEIIAVSTAAPGWFGQMCSED